MRTSKLLFASSVLLFGVGALMFSALPRETQMQKADRAFCNELLKSPEVRVACREITGISKNVKLVDGRITQVGQAFAWHDVNRTLKGDREYDEAIGDRADAAEANSKRIFAQGK